MLDSFVLINYITYYGDDATNITKNKVKKILTENLKCYFVELNFSNKDNTVIVIEKHGKRKFTIKLFNLVKFYIYIQLEQINIFDFTKEEKLKFNIYDMNFKPLK